MDLKNLRTFIYVAELGSFTKAARQLGFAQPTVSAQIRQLEEEMEVRLFERIRHTVNLTEGGRQLLRYAYQVTRLTEELDRDLRLEQGAAGLIRLAMADSLCGPLGRRFRDFWERHPGVRLQITAVGTEEMFRLLNHNEADLVLTLDSRIYDAEYVIIHEKQVETYFVAAPDSPLAGRERVEPEELPGQPFLLTEKNMSYRRLLDQQLAARSLELRPVLETGNVELIRSLARQGVGCAFLPEYAVAEDLAAGRLVRLAVEGLEIGIWQQLLCHRDKWISPQMRAAVEYLQEL
jgi:DNA-binding transcriptional LysR family regulator